MHIAAGTSIYKALFIIVVKSQHILAGNPIFLAKIYIGFLLNLS